MISAYALSLRVTFLSAIAIFLLVNLLTFTLRLPNLRPAKSAPSDEDAPGN